MSNDSDYINNFANAICEGCAAIFAGAGLSRSCGLPLWKDLLRDIANDIGLDVEREQDMLSIPQYYLNEREGDRSELIKKLQDKISIPTEPSESHRILAELPIYTYWTTNYDNLIERAIADAHKGCTVKYKWEDLVTPVARKDVTLYKMHGDIDNEKSIVITKEDYEKYQEENKLFVNMLEADLISKSFLFIGFSFSDPNLLHIISQLKVKLRETNVKHYCIYKMIEQDEFHCCCKFKYAQRREKHWIKDLKRYGINIIPIRSYDEIEKILKSIRSKVLARSVFISGAAQNYSPLSEDKAKELVYKLSKKLVSVGYRIGSGFGLGVGDFVINGALSAVRENKEKRLREALTVYPFPQGITDEIKRAKQWTEHRKELIGQAGVAIFLFGNRLNKDGIGTECSEGMIEEYKIARRKRMLIIPLYMTGATGRATEYIWLRMQQRGLDKFFRQDEQRKLMLELGSKNLETDQEGVINTILKIIELNN